jgi:negative regulator of replication initiation
MAKKVRRVKKRKKVSAANDGAVAVAEIETAVKETQALVFQQEYAYVAKDLRRVLLLSAAMFVLLIALNLLLQV